MIEAYLPVSKNPRILLANFPALPGTSDLSWLPPTQECGFREFANSIRAFLQNRQPARYETTHSRAQPSPLPRFPSGKLSEPGDWAGLPVAFFGMQDPPGWSRLGVLPLRAFFWYMGNPATQSEPD